jgi:DNA-binding LytR/AlgR family response regulator
MSENAPRASPNAPLKLQSAAGFAIAIGAAALMTLVGAFGTSEVPIFSRAIFWFTVMISGSMIGPGVTNLIQGWGRLAARPWWEALLVAAAIAAPLNLIVIAMSAISFGTRMPSPLGLFISFANVFAISLAIVGLSYALAWQRRSAELDLTAAAPTVLAVSVAPTKIDDPAAVLQDRFRERLPLHLRGAELLAVASEDHYLRVYTAAGDTLLLMRLGDALTELEGTPGAQTHRSWWVATAAVTGVQRGAGKAALQLVNGVTAPVSRSFLPVLAQQGWR